MRKQGKRYSPSNPPSALWGNENNKRVCPSCGMYTIEGMPGGRDATCGNCGYKDPCCYD